MDARTTDLDSLRSCLNALVRDSRTPGIQYIVVDRATTLFEHDAGAADLATGRPMQPVTTMMAYSMSKTFTAAAVLQLVEAQKIGLEDSLARYVESQPYGSAITIRQLLSHTSGIPNPIPLRWVHPMSGHEAFNERAALDAVLHKQPQLASAPGTKYAYSNIGYWLLGRVVEEASGEPFTSYVITHVLRPLGITSDEIAYTVSDRTNHASGYLEKYSLMNVIKSFVIDRELIGKYEGPWLQIRDHYLNGPAFGGLVGTAQGFGKFLQDQLREHSCLFGNTTRALFREPQRTTQGSAIPMTLGWHVGSKEDVRFLYKEGGGGGFHSMMRLYPEAGIGTVVMVNATACDVRRLFDAVDRHFLRGAP
jgi:CubicO group peptidase (beta-lactamase class C family)